MTTGPLAPAQPEQGPAPDGLPADDGREPLLTVTDLVKHYPKRGGSFVRHQVGVVHAVCGIDFTINRGETLGMVGESGCGKTTAGRSVLQLVEPTSGSVRFEGRELIGTGQPSDAGSPQGHPGRVQDPFASLDPRMPVGDSIAEPLHIHGLWGRSGRQQVADALSLVGLEPHYANRFPNEFSGGQRQRIGIARALILEPKLLVLDEPVSALDVSIQAGVVNLLEDLQRNLAISYLFIAHDLSVVRHISDRVAVMYLGRIVEIGDRADVSTVPSIPTPRPSCPPCPVPDPRRERSRTHIVLEGDVPSPEHPPSGCRFRTRCWKAQDICAQEKPELVDRGAGHPVACHFPETSVGV